MVQRCHDSLHFYVPENLLNVSLFSHESFLTACLVPFQNHAGLVYNTLVTSAREF